MAKRFEARPGHRLKPHLSVIRTGGLATAARLHCRYRVLLAGLVIFVSLPASAQSPIPEPPIDLGESSFLDGEGGPGPLLEIIGNGYGAIRFNAADAPDDFEETTGGCLIHLVYTSKLQLFGAYVGIEALLPLIYLHLREGGLEASVAGAGDVLMGTYLQWSNLSLLGKPFSMRLDMDVTAPTGPYAANRLLNLGENVWQLYPHFAWTWRVTDRWEISNRTIYNWNGVNYRSPAYLEAQSVQAGDQISNNLSASRAISEHWRGGIASYQLEQLSDTRVNGEPVPGSRERVLGVGPGIYWTKGRMTVIGNVYKEFAAQNRPEGYQGVLRLLITF